MEIEFYRDEAGTSPVKNFLDTQDIRMRQKMMRSIQALQEMGTSLRMPLSESLEDGIFELVKVMTENPAGPYHPLPICRQQSGTDTRVHKKDTKNASARDCKGTSNP